MKNYPEKLTISISDEASQRIKKLPREVKLSEKMRAALDKILNKCEVKQ